jgi:hypothetical protein
LEHGRRKNYPQFSLHFVEKGRPRRFKRLKSARELPPIAAIRTLFLMKIHPFLTTTAIAAFAVAFTAYAAEDDNPIKQAMKFAHSAPRGQKKLNEKIVEGTAADADVAKALAMYKAMADSKPPKGDPMAFKEKANKLVAATQEVVAKKPEAIEHYKSAVDCKACHSEHRKMPPPGGPGRGPGTGAGPAGPFPSPQ